MSIFTPFPTNLLFKRDEQPFNKPWEQWTADWWNWLLQIPKPGNPADDPTGSNCATAQTDPQVWFLAGAYRGRAKRKCSISIQKGILFPIINDEESDIEKKSAAGGPGALPSFSKDDSDNMISLNVIIDEGTSNEYVFYTGFLSQFRVSLINPVNLNIAVNNNLFDLPVPAPPQIPQASADGYWLFLKPHWTIQTGQHTLYFYGKEDDYETEVTYTLNMLP